MTGSSRLSVGEIRATLALARGADLERLVDSLRHDDRAGVRAEVEKVVRREGRRRDEDARLCGLYQLEERLRDEGARLVAGIDEVGRGAVAGPLTVAACILPASPHVGALDDSKRLTRAVRQLVADEIKGCAVAWSVAHVSAGCVDAIGITAALRKAGKMAIAGLSQAPQRVVVDGLGMGIHADEIAVVKGDSSVAAVAAASVLAKVSRDAVMRIFDAKYPEYRLGENKGYGSVDHLTVVSRVGPSPVHRRTFLRGGGSESLF